MNLSMRRLLLLIALLLILPDSTPFARAETQEISPLPQSCAYSESYGNVCLHAFGDIDTHVPLPDTKGFSCDEIIVQLFQLAPNAETEVGKPILLKGENCPYVTLHLPAVTERKIFRVLFSVANSREARFRQNPIVNELLLAVYPENLFGPLRAWAQTGTLVVIDPLQKLIPILDEQKIKFSTTLPSTTALAPVCIWVPVAAGAQGLPFSCRATIILHERTRDLPTVTKLVGGGKVRIDVNMSLIKMLADNPLVQQAFVNMILSAEDPNENSPTDR